MKQSPYAIPNDEDTAVACGEYKSGPEVDALAATADRAYEDLEQLRRPGSGADPKQIRRAENAWWKARGNHSRAWSPHASVSIVVVRETP